MVGKRQFVNELMDRDQVDDHFSVTEKRPPAPYKNGYRFDLLVSDMTGDMELTYWGPKDEDVVRRKYDSLRMGDVIRVRGSVSEFRDSLNIAVNPSNGGDIKVATADDYEMSDFVACTEKDQDEMFSQLHDYIGGLKDPNLRSLLLTLFEDEEFAHKFKNAPASVKHHCNWIGGLLEHTLNVIRICEFTAHLYPKLDRDLLVTSAILHDIGKVNEYTVSTTIGRSTDGKLMGHLVMGAEMVRKGCDQVPDFPENLKIKLVHMVLASHGSRENGSPTEPSFPEAMALSFADDMDAKLEQFIKAKEDGGSDDLFVHDRRLGRWIYLQ